jgi:hypothetical protein
MKMEKIGWDTLTHTSEPPGIWVRFNAVPRELPNHSATSGLRYCLQ